MTRVQGGAHGSAQVCPKVPRPLIRQNDYSHLEPPVLGQWRPQLDVSVVIPAFGGQEKLDLTLASLAAQSYPGPLTQVVVVDDGSDPPLVLPPIRPENTVLVTSGDGGWGAGHAVRVGAGAAEGAVVLRLDSDMIAFREHVESQMRWHHLADYVAVVGHLRFVDHRPGSLSPEQVASAVQGGEAQTLFEAGGEEMEWLAKAYRNSGNLRRSAHKGYLHFIGGTSSVSRSLLIRSGGTDPALALGQDTHLGYRLAQQGAVFVPDLDSSSWHLGLPQMHRSRQEGHRYRTPFVGHRLPLAAGRGKLPGRRWQVPLVDVVVDTVDAGAEEIVDTVDRLLGGSTTDLRVALVTSWPGEQEHGAPGGRPQDLSGTREHYRSEPRVRFVRGEPEPDPDVPFVLRVRPGFPLAADTLRRMIEVADLTKVGLVRATMPGDDLGGPRLERVAAFARARHLGAGDPDLDRVVDEVYGIHWIDGESLLESEQAGNEEPEAAPEDWAERLWRAEQEARVWEARAERLARRYRWLTGTRLGRRVLRVFG